VDPILQALGLHWKLTPAVWDAAFSITQGPQPRQVASADASPAATGDPASPPSKRARLEPTLTTTRQHAPATSQAQQQAAPALLTMEAALPASLLHTLQQGFAPAAPFWHQHSYHKPSTPFFSYLYPLQQAPGTAVEQAIARLHQQLTTPGSPVARVLQKACCAEWWAHCRCAATHCCTDAASTAQGQRHGWQELTSCDHGSPTTVC
jgi:hypothetical protein